MMKEVKVVSFWEADYKGFFVYCVFVFVVIACLIFFTSKIDIPVSVVAQDEITILRKAEEEINCLSDFTVGQRHENARSLAILAIAEQLKRIADALEGR